MAEEAVIINEKDLFYTHDHGDKYANLGYISLGFFLGWLVIGTILALYVNS